MKKKTGISRTRERVSSQNLDGVHARNCYYNVVVYYDAKQNNQMISLFNNVTYNKPILLFDTTLLSSHQLDRCLRELLVDRLYIMVMVVGSVINNKNYYYYQVLPPPVNKKNAELLSII